MSPKKILSILILFAALSSLILIARTQDRHLEENTQKYTSIAYGISFAYPSNYFLEEKTTGTPQRSRYTITLTKDTEENRLAREKRSSAKEGPISITIDIFQNLEKQSVESWIRGMNESNFKLGDGSLLPITLYENKEALSYRWKGPYEGNSVVFAHRGNIVMMSVTFSSPTDEIVSIFESILTTTTLE